MTYTNNFLQHLHGELLQPYVLQLTPMLIRLYHCFLLLLLSLTVAPVQAQEVYYHWVGADEVWVWQTEGDANTVVLRLDAAGAVANPPQDSLLQARFGAMLPGGQGSVWDRLVARLQEADAQEQQAARQGRQAYRGFAAPRHPDVHISVFDSLGHVMVDIQGQTLAHHLAFRREAQAGRLRPVAAGQSYDWLAALFGQQRVDSLSMLRVARLFEPERAVAPGDAAAWDAFFGTWLATLPTPPTPLLYQTDVAGRGPWEWASVAYRRVAPQIEAPATDNTTRNALAAGLVLALLAAGLGLAAWAEKRTPSAVAAPKRPQTAPLPEAEASSEETDIIPIKQIRVSIDEHLGKLEQAYGRYEDILPQLPQGDKAALQQTLDLAQTLTAWYEANRQPSGSTASWYPRPGEDQKAWFTRLVEQEVPARDTQLAAQRDDIGTLEKRVVEALTIITTTQHNLDRLRRGEAVAEGSTGRTGTALQPRDPIPPLDENVKGVGNAMKDNQDRLKDVGDLRPLASNLFLGQRSFLDQHNDAQLDNALAGLIDYSLAQLALALAEGSRHGPGARAMWVNLYTITRNLQVFNQKTIHGFDLAFEALQRQNVAHFKKELPAPPEKHGPVAKPFLVRLKFLRDVARVNLQPFYYVDDQNRIKTIGKKVAS